MSQGAQGMELRKLEEASKQTVSLSLRRQVALQTPWFWPSDLGLWTPEYIHGVLNCQLCGNLFQ